MPKSIDHKELTDSLALTECRDGFWLYAKDVGMNISMRAPTAEDALLQGLKYYQRRFTEYKRAYEDVQSKVDAFVALFPGDPEDTEF